MLILTALNVTGKGDGVTLAREDGTADYEVWIGINHHCIWRGDVKNFRRDKMAAALLRAIADRMDATET